jgi:hypothetical protein
MSRDLVPEKQQKNLPFNCGVTVAAAASCRSTRCGAINKDFQRVMATGSDEQRRVAILALEVGHQRREVLGWDASVLFFVIAQWDNYEAEIRDHQIRLTRLPIQAR